MSCVSTAVKRASEMLFGTDRTALRRTFAQAWQHHLQGVPLEPLQAQIVKVVAEHPEYHRTVEDADALDRDYLPEGGQSNPFLHMAMHLALLEQCANDRPSGISKAMARAQRRSTSSHETQHQAMECLGRVLWEAQAEARAPDEGSYLRCVQSLTKRARRTPK
jgi:hypothetical protein